MYSIRFLSARVERELQRLPPQDKARTVLRLRQLEQDPRPPGVAALASNVYRVRVGRYRVLYRVDDEAQEVVVARIARRSEATYRDWEDLFR